MGKTEILDLDALDYRMKKVEWDYDNDFRIYFFLTTDLDGEELCKFNERAVKEGINWNLFYIESENLYTISFQKGKGCLECLKTRLKAGDLEITDNIDSLSEAKEEALEIRMNEVIEGGTSITDDKLLEIDLITKEQKIHPFFALKHCKICKDKSEDTESLKNLKNAAKDLSK